MAQQQRYEMRPLGQQHEEDQDVIDVATLEGKTWREVFYQLAEMDGEVEEGKEPSINIKKLKDHFRTQPSYMLEQRTGLPRYRLMYIADKASKADSNKDGRIVLSEWKAYMDKFGRDFLDSGVSGGVLRVLAYAPAYSCNPPTVFLITITLAQIVCFILSILAPETLGIDNAEFGQRGWPLKSVLIYNPHRRKEAWRFLSYMFLHGSYEHITFNCLMQLLVGIPIEMSQLGWIGCFRVAILYLSGVALGALGASVSEPNKYMLGASAGVYALIAAHLATLILNWNEDGKLYSDRKDRSRAGNVDVPPSLALNPFIRAMRLLFIILFTALDVGQAIYKVYFLGEPSTTSYSGHAFGALSGLLVGVFVLENRKVEDWEKIFQWIALTGYSLFLLMFVVWHIAGSYTGWFPEQWV